jgi:hypothetical protein
VKKDSCSRSCIPYVRVPAFSGKEEFSSQGCDEIKEV